MIKKQRRDAFLGARFPVGDVELVWKATELRGEDVSVFLRRAVRRELSRLSLLDEESRRALELG